MKFSFFCHKSTVKSVMCWRTWWSFIHTQNKVII